MNGIIQAKKIISKSIQMESISIFEHTHITQMVPAINNIKMAQICHEYGFFYIQQHKKKN